MAKQVIQEPVGLIEVRITDPTGVVVGDRVRRPGEVIRLDHTHAKALVDDRRAAWCVRIEMLESVLVGNRVLEVGAIVEVHRDTALRLHADGVAKILDPDKLGGVPVPAVRPRPKPVVPRDPLDSEPKLNVRLVGPVIVGTKVVGPKKGQPAEVHSLPESKAVHALVGGAGTLGPGAKLSEAGYDLFRRLGGKPSLMPQA